MSLTPRAANTPVPSSTVAQVIVRENLQRREVFINNASTAILYLLYGQGPGGLVSSTNYSLALPANTSGVATLIEDQFAGEITGVWASANGFAYVCEISD